MDQVKRTNESSLEITIPFTEPEMRDEFEAALRGWCVQYRRQATTEILLRTLARATGARETQSGENDVSGYLLADNAIVRELGEIRRDVQPGLREMMKFIALGAIGAMVVLAPWVFIITYYT